MIKSVIHVFTLQIGFVYTIEINRIRIYFVQSFLVYWDSLKPRWKVLNATLESWSCTIWYLRIFESWKLWFCFLVPCSWQISVWFLMLTYFLCFVYKIRCPTFNLNNFINIEILHLLSMIFPAKLKVMRTVTTYGRLNLLIKLYLTHFCFVSSRS